MLKVHMVIEPVSGASVGSEAGLFNNIFTVAQC